MRIKKLDIFGFKSFATRQTISFGDGTTGIVGPNGCGKSNVVDALKWVMGEQNARQLRGGQMQDIIFCGSDKKSPLGFAEVILTLENDSGKENVPLDYQHFSEIQITRRLYKTGESDFEINKQKVRLKDIQEFFLGTGIGAKAYSIIEQGRVNQVISAKPIDKRTIIEEAAGITKYKSKKNAAEKRIENTKLNLSRITDIHKEVEKRVISLAKEKEKLEAVLSIKEKIKSIDLHLSTHKFLELTAKKQFFEKEIIQYNDSILKLKRDFAFDEQSFEKIFQEYVKEKDERDLLEKLKNQHLTTLELTYKDKTYAEQTLNDNKILMQRLSIQIEDIEKRLSEIEQEIEMLNASKLDSSELLNKIELDWKDNDEKTKMLFLERKSFLQNLENLQSILIAKASNASKLQTQISSTKSLEKQRQQQVISLEDEITQIKREITFQEDNLAKLKNELAEGKTKSEDLNAALKIIEDKIYVLKNEEREVKNNLSSIQKEHIRLSSRHQSLEEIHKQLKWSQSGSAKIVASEKKDLVVTILADALDVKTGYEQIVEKTFSHVLDSVVVQSDANLLELSNYFRQEKISNTTFFCLDSIGSHSVKNLENAVCLLDFITIKNEKYKNLESYLASYFLVDDLALGLGLWQQAQEKKINLITPNFELLLFDKRAIFIGEKDDKGILKRKSELEKLEQEIDIVLCKEKEIAALEQLNRENLSVAFNEKNRITAELKPLDFGLVRLSESIKQKEILFLNVSNQLNKLNSRLNELLNHSKNVDEEILGLEKEWSLSLSEHKKIEDEISLLKEQRDKIEESYENQSLSLKKIEIERNSLRDKIKSSDYAIEQAKKNTSHLSEQKKSFLEQHKEKNDEELILEETVRQASKKIDKIKEELRNTESSFILSEEKCKNLFEQKKKAELNLGEIKNNLSKEQEKIYKKEIELNNLENSIAYTIEKINERYEADLLFFISDYHHVPINEKEASKQYTNLRQELQSMGAVNETAEKEYSEYKRRCDFLSAQIEDLSSALLQLENAIEKINKTTCMRFIEAFNSINTQFSTVFTRLFGGGKAELVLTDPADLLNSGVEIMAKPPGKNINSIELMSGGEKALTAISLIISIFLIKPSPFCLLDEVDAPLDEANVSRFNSLIREISKICQVILITHNRKTMESADRLFGVTMQDAGCSKIVYADINNAFEKNKTSENSAGYNKPTQLFLATE